LYGLDSIVLGFLYLIVQRDYGPKKQEDIDQVALLLQDCDNIEEERDENQSEDEEEGEI
jgi:hypothetical protein